MDATCPGCGRPGTLANDVLEYVRGRGVVRVRDVSEGLALPRAQAVRTLCHLADRGLLARVRRGAYSADPEIQRRALLDRLARLTPA